MHHQIITQVIHASALENADGQTVATKIATTNQLECWTTISAISGTGATIELILECSVDGTNWLEVGRNSSVIGTGTYAIATARGDTPLGTRARLRWDMSGTTPTVTFVSTLAYKEGV